MVHFTQNACADTARDLLSTNFSTKEEKHAITRTIDSAKKSASTLEQRCWPPEMITMEERVKSLEQKVAVMKAFRRRTASVKSDWESTVGAFESDPLFKEAMSLGREYRESQPTLEDGECA